MELVSSGDDALDRILGGGFTPGSLVVLAGAPGTGKTILAQQLVFSNATEEHPALYYTTLSEPHSKLVRHLQPFTFFDPAALGRSVYFLHLTEMLQGATTGDRGVDAVIDEIVEQAFDRSPSFIVLDSAKALHHFGDPGRLRERVFTLAARVSHTGSVLLLVGEYGDASEDGPEFAVADGILQLAVDRSGPSDERRLRVIKLRGRDFLAGEHSFRIGDDGYRLFPRLETVAPTRPAIGSGRAGFGISTVDRMLDGGLPMGQGTLLMGPSGSGKTALATHFIGAGLAAGQRGLFLTLEETSEELVDKAETFGLGFRDAIEAGDLEVVFSPPMELEIDEVGNALTRRVAELRPDRVVVDGIGDLIPASRRWGRFPSYLWALMSALRATGAAVVFTYEVTALGGGSRPRLDALSYLFHNVMVLRYMERGTELGRVLNVLKMRSSAHDKGLLQFEITAAGVQPLGQPGDVDATLGWRVLGHATGD